MATSKKVVPPLETMLVELQNLASRIANVDAGTDARSVKKIRLELERAVSEIKATTERLDPVWRPESIFDPSDPNTAGRVVALTMVAQERHSLAAIPEFYGAGVYAIYYRGDFSPYLPLKDTDHPIYVGKADPDRQGAKDAVTQGTKLSARLNEHARSIRKATTTLKIEDFECRFLIVQSGYQSKRPPTAVYPWVPHDAMIEFGAQIDCVHKFIYGHNNSTSYNQGETRAISPSQR